MFFCWCLVGLIVSANKIKVAVLVRVSILRQFRIMIENQEGHHRKFTFQEGYRELMRRHGTELDERNVELKGLSC